MKAYIHSKVADEDRAALEAILREAECEIAEELQELDCEIGAEDRVDDKVQPVCLVVLTAGLAEDDLEPELTGAVSRGCRVIGIWGVGSDGDTSPLGDYGADTVAWDPPRIRKAVCDEPQHQAPDGQEAPPPDATHGGC